MSTQWGISSPFKEKNSFGENIFGGDGEEFLMIGGNTYGLSQRTVKWGKDHDSNWFKNVNKHRQRKAFRKMYTRVTRDYARMVNDARFVSSSLNLLLCIFSTSLGQTLGGLCQPPPTLLTAGAGGSNCISQTPLQLDSRCRTGPSG